MKLARQLRGDPLHAADQGFDRPGIVPESLPEDCFVHFQAPGPVLLYADPRQLAPDFPNLEAESVLCPHRLSESPVTEKRQHVIERYDEAV